MSLTRANRPASALRRRLRRIFLTVLAMVVLVVLGTVAINLSMVAYESGRIYKRVEDVPVRDVGLVLGTGPGTLYSDDRLEAALALYQAGKVRHLLVSGSGPPPQYDEVDQMRVFLVKRGVPATDISEDHAGWRTLDSMARAKTVFGLDSMTIISQGVHLPRSLFLAQHWGIDAVGFAAVDPDHFFGHTHLREWLARVLAVMDVTFLQRQPRDAGSPEPIVLPPAVKAGQTPAHP